MKKIVILLIILLPLGGLAAYRIHKKMTIVSAESIDKQQLQTGVPVRVFALERRDLQKTVSISGSIEAFKAVSISPMISEHIEKIEVGTGEKVGQGDLLLRLDATKSKLHLGQAEAFKLQAEQSLLKLENGARPEEIEGAQMRLEQAEALYDLQKNELDRQKGLYAEGATTEQALQNAENQTKSSWSSVGAARAQLELLKAGARDEDIELGRIQVKLAQVALEQAQENLNDHYLYTPIDGRVTLREYEQGDITEVNKTIFQVVQLDQVYLVLDVSELYIPKLALGMEVAVKVDPLADRSFTGHIKEINPVANSQDRSYRTKILIDNKEELLKPGMFGRAEMVVEQANGVLAAPGDALRVEGEQTYVLIVDENLTAQRRDVTVVGIYGRFVQLAGEIAEGDKIISFAQEIVQPGVKVKVAQGI